MTLFREYVTIYSFLFRKKHSQYLVQTRGTVWASVLVDLATGDDIQ